jgi:cell wall-associated NlpC family hydrolase
MTCRPLPVRQPGCATRREAALCACLALSLLVVAVVLLVAAGPAAANPRIEAKRAQAAQVLADVRALDSQLEKAVEAYNGATVRLEQIERQLSVNKREMGVARANLRVARSRLAARLRDLYMGADSTSTFELLVGATSIDDLISRLDTIDRVSAEDGRVLAEVKRFRREVVRRRAFLRRARAAQVRVVAERARAKARIEAGLAERRRLLASIQSEIERLQAAERRRQALLAAQAQARLRAQEQAQQRALASAVVGAAAETPEAAVLPPARYGGVVGIAMQYLGVPYRWGGASPATGFDCSGFVMYVYAQVGVSLPHYAAAQYGYGVPVPKDQLQPGDVVFFDGLGHNGIYIGGGQFIHSPHTGDVVKISSLSDPWYAARWVGARRLL